MSVEKFVDYTQIINTNYRILFFDVKYPTPTPLQWTFCMNEFKENLEHMKDLNCKFAFVMDVRKIGMISTDYIMEFTKLLMNNGDLLEERLIATTAITEGIIINKLFDIIKMFYKTKKPLELVKDMKKAIEFIDKHI